MTSLLAGETELALHHLDSVERFTERMIGEYPQYALEPNILNWEGRLLRARILGGNARHDDARRVLNAIVAEAGDPLLGPTAGVVTRARSALAA